ncbi:MAG: hypothetical protein HY960_15420 [Ignavibacteriae bacterium]|nr:hypothetical protein [Ignavibacteriota bacterium]
MSLKSFHIFFITVSTLFAFGFAAWFIKSYNTSEEVSNLFAALLSAISGVGLIIYGIRFLKKLQHVRFL